MIKFGITLVEENGYTETYNFDCYDSALDHYNLLVRQNKTADIYLDIIIHETKVIKELTSRIVY